MTIAFSGERLLLQGTLFYVPGAQVCPARRRAMRMGMHAFGYKPATLSLLGALPISLFMLGPTLLSPN